MTKKIVLNNTTVSLHEKGKNNGAIDTEVAGETRNSPLGEELESSPLSRILKMMHSQGRVGRLAEILQSGLLRQLFIRFHYLHLGDGRPLLQVWVPSRSTTDLEEPRLHRHITVTFPSCSQATVTARLCFVALNLADPVRFSVCFASSQNCRSYLHVWQPNLDL